MSQTAATNWQDLSPEDQAAQLECVREIMAEILAEEKQITQYVEKVTISNPIDSERGR